MTYEQNLFTTSSIDAFKAPPHGPFRLARQAFNLVGTWMERRRQRRDLSGLDDQMLKDIGVTRAEAAREIAKPFWR